MRQALILAASLLAGSVLPLMSGETPDPARDGIPRLGVNFLIPYDRTPNDPAKQRGTLRTFGETPKGLNSFLDNSTTSTIVGLLTSDSLCERSITVPDAWQSSLAESVVISDDWKTFTFSIRKGVQWQRPACASKPAYAWLDRDVPMTAKDIAFTIEVILNPQVDCPSLRNYYEDIEKVETPDDQTLIVRWKRKQYTNLDCSVDLSPTPRHIYACNRDGTPIPAERFGAAFNKHWFDEIHGVVGVGPYRLEIFEPDNRAIFVRNPSYWGVPLHFDRIEQNLLVKEPAARLVAFKNGQVHTYALTPLQYKSEVLDRAEPRFAAFNESDPKAGRKGELGWERIKDNAFYYLGWNLRRAPFDDKRVRQAMAHIFPKSRIIRDVYFGLGQSILADAHPDTPYYHRDLKPFRNDAKLARDLLTAAGWVDSDGDGLLDKTINGQKVKFSFTIKYYANSPEWDNALGIFRNELKKFGIECKPTPLEWKELLRVYEDKDFDAVTGGWQKGWDLDYYQTWHSSQAEVQSGSNHCGFKNARVDELAEKLRLIFPIPERIAICKEIQAILHEEQPYLFFRSAEAVVVWQNLPPAGSSDRERWLDGVVRGLDEYHPLMVWNSKYYVKDRRYWHLRN